MNILQIISGLDVNGALEHCRLLSRQLCRRGHRVTILCREGSWLWKHVDDMPVQVVQCEMNRWPLSDARRMAEWVQRQSFDVMHSHMSRAHMYGILLRQLTGVPVVATAHCQHFQPHWHLNDHVIANSASTSRYLRRVIRLAVGKTTMVHCFVDLERFTGADPQWRRGIRRQWRVGMDQPVIGIAGDVVPYKGHWHLFRALPELVRQFPDLKLIVVGRFHRSEKYTRRLRAWQRLNGLERRVKWLGRRDNMHQVLAALDVVVIPSLVESMGMVALEAMAAGVSVVASRTGGLSELIHDRWNGLLVPRQNPPALARGVAEVLSDRTRAGKFARNGRTWVSETFSPDVVTARIEGLYDRVAGGGIPVRGVPAGRKRAA